MKNKRHLIFQIIGMAGAFMLGFGISGLTRGVTAEPIPSMTPTPAPVESAVAADVPSATSVPMETPETDEASAPPAEQTDYYAAQPVGHYKGLSLTDQEKIMLACTVYQEAGNQSFDGQVAVAQVALNRLVHPSFEYDSLYEVLYAPHQFATGSYYEDRQLIAVEDALAGNPILDMNPDVVYFSTGGLNYGSYYKTVGDHVFRTYY